MAQITEITPTIGQPNASEDQDIVNAFSGIYGAINGGLDNSNLSGSAAITDANLASPNNGAYKTISEIRGYATAAAVTSSGSYFMSDGGGVVASGGAIPITPPGFVPIESDHDVSNKTTKLRIRALVGTGGTAVGTTINIGIGTYSLSASNLTIVSTYLATTAITTVANSTVNATSGEITLSSPGSAYAWFLSSDGAWTGGTGIWFQAALQVRNT